MKLTKERKCLIISAVIVLILFALVMIMLFPSTRKNADGSYAHFQENDNYVRVLRHPAFQGYSRFLVPFSTDIGRSFLCFQQIGGDGRSAGGQWSCNNDNLAALNLLIDKINAGDTIFYNYYTPEEIEQDNTKADTGLFFIKGNPGAPFVVLEGGGGFQDVGTLNEGLASGVPFVEAGYNVFSVKYRAEFTEVVPGQPNNVTAVQDLGRAMQFIFDNAGPDKLFDIDTEHYALGGFSAGSSLAHNWAVEGVGFDQYGVPAPELMILIYGASANYTSTSSNPFAASEEALPYPDTYPATFTVACENDTRFAESVSIFNEKADAIGIPNYCRVVSGGYHGFARGTGLEGVEGWGEQCIKFWQSGFDPNAIDWPGNLLGD